MYKVGIIGTGHLRTKHINNWKDLPQVSLVGLCDPNNNDTPEAETDQALRRYDSLDELINACDIIDIVAPAAYRFGICEKAIRKGKHVLVESPMAFSMNEADQLVKLVQESSVKLQVAHTERFNPAYLALKGHNTKPLYIEAHRLVPSHSQKKGINLVFELLIRDIDVVLSLVPSEVKSIAASGIGVISHTPDLVNIRIEFNNGCVANLTASRVATEEENSMRLFQKDAIFDIDFLNQKTVITQPENSGSEGPLSLNRSKLQTPLSNPFREELEAFITSIQNNTWPVGNEIDGYRAMEVAHQILKKINSNLSTAH
jgi:predicted dehydrogenase